ncbi:MAG: carbohydrate ABC transporter permease [Acidimicrobiales bacterium]|jgi:sn-glycerol 3-phosphate transport system permease protein|nr:carbohydrate ABC transporter permease [Acidimicrobiales bacterium]
MSAGTAPADGIVTRHSRSRTAGRYLLLVLVAAVVLLPVYVTVVGAIQPATRVLDYPRSLVPWPLTLTPLRNAWDDGDLGRSLLNSLVVTVLITSGQVVTSVLAASAFAFLRFPFRRTLFAVFMATLLVPTEVTIVANFQTIRSLGWLDTYQGLVTPFVAAAFGTFLLRQAFLALPKELKEAADMDGMGHWSFVWGVAVPLARPAIGALTVFSFLTAWNQYLWPLLATNDADMRTAQIGVRSLAASNIEQPNLVMAGTLLVALPIVVLLVLFQRQLIRGLTAGAVKG